MIRFGSITIDRAARILTCNGVNCYFPPHKGKDSIRFRLIEILMLSERGKSCAELFDILYGHDSEGGPLDGIHIFLVHFAHLNAKIAPLGLRIVGTKNSGTTYYRAVQK